MADSLLQKATSALGEAKGTVITSVETVKTDVVKDAVHNVVSRGIDGAKSLVHNLEEKKGEVSSKIVGAVTHFTGSADNQPLLAAGDREVETPWWKNCCEVLDLLKTSSSSSSTPK
ncbi:PREDICTED: uncharacterized protein LOC104739206 [Camelina sativa]|uniref:Uncharacterized protein LOC104739206 n=1 Tax=Camelina sativa TaxID=90675 RepID=A0ABM0VKY9_CAMSA|nr:PREDICTED: uncharacterized protein LOC104739206 [Camelina sativa]